LEQGDTGTREGATEIRRPTVADVDAMQALFALTWHATYDVMLGREQVERYVAGYFSRNQLLAHINAASMLNPIYVAFVDAAIAGIITMRHTLMFSGVLDMLYIDPSHQRRGVGRMLLNRALDDGFSRMIYLEVLPKNEAAIQAYMRMGFKAGGVHPSLSDPLQEILVMSKRLKPSPLQMLTYFKAGIESRLSDRA
jgi:ribosomal protein S18 acetylase RimI-like enzyme